MKKIKPKYDDCLDTVVKCPYCGYIQDNEVTYGLNDGDTIECENCGKKFYVNIHIEYISSPDCELNGEKHKWALEDKEHNFYVCEICGATKVEFKD